MGLVRMTPRLLVSIAAVAATHAVLVLGACGPLAGRCTSNDDCARAVCVDGACVDGFIGEMADVDPSRERGEDARTFDELERPQLVTRPLFTSPSEPPPPPGPGPTPINDDDDDELSSSCLAYLQEHDDAVSGFYTVRARNGDPIVVECDMDSDGGGWTIVADKARDGCPSGWATTLSGDCDRGAFEQVASASFPLVVPYNEIRGSARARSSGQNRAFDVGYVPEYVQSDWPYVDGLALSVNDDDDGDGDGDGDGTRNHLWTFAAGGVDEEESTACPAHGGAKPPSDVDGAYSCDTPRLTSSALWDGEGFDDDDEEDVGDFTRQGAPQGALIEARIMSPIEGIQSRVWITSLEIAVR
jgi:hypothetical protein